MRCPNCQTINPPQAKFCLECGKRLMACPECGTINPSNARFCIECGTSLQALQQRSQNTTNSSSTTTDPEQGLPQATVERFSPPLPPPEERRVVTIMFADITGSTPLADRLDPEDMRAILIGYFNLMTEQIRRHGGTVEKYIGDAIMAVFGSPTAHEDDPDRALRAALDMQQALDIFNRQRQKQDMEATRLQMRIGINTGEVAAAPGDGIAQRQDFLITGDAVNIAARLQQSAQPDTILVGERTYLSTREVFTFRTTAPLMLKGKPEPMVAYELMTRKQAAVVAQSPRGLNGQISQLVGRTLELTLLHANYARVQAERRPHLITILGVPGVGKSRLVNEFVSREQERTSSMAPQREHASPLVLKGRCPPYGEGITYWPLVEILRTLIHVQGNESNEQLQQRFMAFVRQTLVSAGRSEAAEEIAETLLHGIGSDLSESTRTTEQQHHDAHAGIKRQSKTRHATIKQSGAQGALLRAWRVLIEALGDLRPLIIVVDDLQWADEALLNLLEYLTDRISATPVLFLCPARPDFFEQRRDWGGGHRNFTTIELESLSWDESSLLVDALLNTSELPETLRYTILTRAEGNPFFVEEIIRMLIDQDILVPEETQEPLKTSWRVEYTGDPAEDALIERHYLLPLPHVPDTIQGVLAARVDLLHPTEKLLLQLAAIVGRTFWLSALLELAGGLAIEHIEEALTALIRRNFVVESTKRTNIPVEDDRIFNFKHILTRDVVYNTIPRQRRALVHAHLALWLATITASEPERFIELVANHYQQALSYWSAGSGIETLEIEQVQKGPARKTIHLTRAELRQRTIHYLTLAGDQALHNYYTLRALRAYSDAFELLRDSHAHALTRSHMLEKLGDAYVQRGNLNEAWEEYRNALQLVADKEEASNRRYLLSLYERLALPATRWQSNFNTLPDAQEIRRYIDAGLQLLEGKPISRERIAFLTYLAFWHVRQMVVTQGAQKATFAEQALLNGHEALKQAEILGDAHTLSLALDAIGFIYGEHLQYKRELELQQRRQQLEGQLQADRDELYDMYFSLGRAYEQTSLYPEALAYYGRAWDNARTMESPVMLISCLVGRMRVWKQWNRWDEASQVAQELLHLIEKYQQDEKRQLWALETLATIAYHRGNTEDGEEYARQCKRLLDEHTGYVKGERSDISMRAIYLASGDEERALHAHREKLRQSEPFPPPELLATLAELEVTQHQQAASLDFCTRALRVSEEAGSRKSVAIALRALGRLFLHLHRWEDAENTLHQSLQHCQELDLPWEQGHTFYFLGQLYIIRAGNTQQIQGDRERARYHFEMALGFYQSLQAQPAITRVQHELQQVDRLHMLTQKPG